MTRFHYQAMDAAGERVVGEIEAADEAAARETLAARGLAQCLFGAPPESARATLSSADSVELTTRLSELTTAQLPLAPGLRAWGRELPPGRLAAAVESLANHLERGVPLDLALDMPATRAPAHLRGLLTSGLKSGQLGPLLEQYLAHERTSHESRRRLRSAIAYPMLVVAALGLWLLFISQVLAPSLAKAFADLENIFAEFGIESPTSMRSPLSASENAPRLLGGAVVSLLAALALTGLLGGWRRLCNVLAETPLFGPLWRDGNLAEAAGMLSLLLEHSTPLPTALRWTAAGLRDAGVADACRTAADRIAAGQAFSDCIAESDALPPLLLPIVAWGERSSSQPAALRTAAEMLRDRIALREQFIAIVVPPIAFIMVGLVVVYCVSGLFTPIIWLIRSLSFLKNTSPPIYGTVLSSAVATLSIGAALLLASRLFYGRRRADNDPVRQIIHSVAWMAIVVGAVVAALASVFGVPLLLAAVLIQCMVWVQWRRTQQVSLAAILAMAAEKGLPLPATLDAFALEQWGRFARLTRRLAEKLRAGTPLAEALASQRGLLPPTTKLAIRIGAEHQRLASALREQVRGQNDLRPLRQTLASQFPYIFVMLSAGPTAIVFMLTRIAPSYEKIFDDFGVALPAVTRLFSDTLRSPLTLPIVAAAALAALLSLACGSLWYIGWLSWPPPGLNRLLRRFDRAMILRALAIPVELERPLEPILGALARDYPSGGVRRQLKRAIARMAGGQTWIASLLETGLVGRADAAVLEAAQRAGNLTVLREMADSNERRLLHRLEAIARIGSVSLVAVFGAITFVFAVAFFQPLVDLIWSLTNA